MNLRLPKRRRLGRRLGTGADDATAGAGAPPMGKGMGVPVGDLGPLPSPEQWEESVRTAMRAGPVPGRIAWTPREGGRWDLHGGCPRCHDHTSKILSDLVVSDGPFESAGDVDLNWACSC